MYNRSKGASSPSGTVGRLMCSAKRQGSPAANCGIGNSLRTVYFGERTCVGSLGNVGALLGSHVRASISSGVNSGSATNGGLRRLRSSSSVHNGFAARYRRLPGSFLTRTDFRFSISGALRGLKPLMLIQFLCLLNRGEWPICHSTRRCGP